MTVSLNTPQSPTEPPAHPPKNHNTKNPRSNPSPPPKIEKYRALVIDSGAIIKGACLTLHSSADEFYTIAGVLEEIRDKKARHHLDSLPFELKTREPGAEACRAVAAFARLTGDYRSLSLVDLKVLALQYELEVEGCGSADHLRKEPKRALIGKIKPLNTSNDKNTGTSEDAKNSKDDAANQNNSGILDMEVEEGTDDEGAGDSDGENDDVPETKQNDEEKTDEIKQITWAMMVNPSAATSKATITSNPITPPSLTIAEENMAQSFGTMTITSNLSQTVSSQSQPEDRNLGGQFDDASDEDDEEEAKHTASDTEISGEVRKQGEPVPACGQFDDASDDEDEAKYAASDAEISDEECDVYILDPEETDARKSGVLVTPSPVASHDDDDDDDDGEDGNDDGSVDSDLYDDLQSEFPSLAAAATVRYEGSDTEEEKNGEKTTTQAMSTEQGTEISQDPDDEERGHTQSATDNTNDPNSKVTLKPKLNQTGKYYNSFSKYSSLITPNGIGNVKQKAEEKRREKEKQRLLATSTLPPPKETTTTDDVNPTDKDTRSRITGGNELAGQANDVEDDGDGWITVTDLTKAKKTGFDGFTVRDNAAAQKNRRRPDDDDDARRRPNGIRCALTTTDFAVQNVLLQMGLPLLGVDGVTVTRAKLWVARCAACFTIYNNATDRLFCERCGNATLERIAASVDGKTGRLRLHFSRRRAKRGSKLRGTKFSLPKPGQGNRFQGDLLLREDQLLMGAWNQKVKKGSKHVESIFGSDITSHVGLGDLTKRSDIRVGFGGKNPNASKHGRERRGKKKKSKEKACGLRRY